MKPEQKSIIKLSSSRVSGLESLYVNKAIEKNELSYHGSFIEDIEGQFETYFKHKKVVALNSGTSAIHLALIMAGVQKGDEVLCQTFTYAASVFPIAYTGAQPIFIESEEESWNMCPNNLEQAIKNRILSRKKPKAIIVVHSYGMPANIEEISRIARTYSISLIEDAAEALGSEVNGKKCGSFGTFGIISFNTNKIITSAGGGLLLCNSEKEKSRIVQLATQAKSIKPYYHHKAIGYNYKMNNINAAILKAQLSILKENLVRKRVIHDFYAKTFDGNEFINLQEGYSKSIKSNFWLNCILFKDKKLKDIMENRFLEANIETRPLWNPMHLQPIFKERTCYGKPVSESLFEHGMCLPSGTSLTDSQLKKIVDMVFSVIANTKQ